MGQGRDVSEWSALRDAWLNRASAGLAEDPRVVAWGLVGSFGRGAADEWSDLDLLIVTDDTRFDDFIERARNPDWSTAELFIDARRNAPVGAMSAATVAIRAGLPIWIDWHVYPLAMAAWPSDCAVQYGAERVPQVSESFAKWNGREPRQPPRDTSPKEELQARLAMAAIAGKYVARRSALALPMLEFLGAPVSTTDPVQQLAALNTLVEQLAPDCPARLAAALREYLSLVTAAIG